MIPAVACPQPVVHIGHWQLQKGSSFSGWCRPNPGGSTRLVPAEWIWKKIPPLDNLPLPGILTQAGRGLAGSVDRI